MAVPALSLPGAVHLVQRKRAWGRRKPEPVWFALSADRQLGFFAGIWTRWTCTRKLAEGEITCDLFGFLTTEPNAEVGAVHPKAMPVILTRPEDFDIWLNAPWAEAAQLQRPLADGALAVVARGAGQDGQAAVQNRASGQASLIFP